MPMKGMDELMSDLENKEQAQKEKHLEKIIQKGISDENDDKKITSVFLDEKTKKEFQAAIKKTGLSMSNLFNAFMKAYLKNSEIRKTVISEIAED